MHHDLALLATFTMAIITAFAGGYIARRLGLPTLVGYLVAGLVIGPFTPGFVGDASAINSLAEMGVIFMMFGVGLHFSLKDLWSVRRIAIPGAILQTMIATLLGFALTQLWGWTVPAGLVLGLAIAVASTVVLLRGLEDNGYLHTSHGKVAIGWLVFEDVATVVILVLLPTFFGDNGGNPLESISLAIIKTTFFMLITIFLGGRVMPWLLTKIAHARSRELFILAVIALALGTAYASAELFGVSLALGAFLAGVVIGESDVGHQVGAEVIPFRDIFSVLFFVSVGMLVNPSVLIANAGQVLALTFLIIFGKGIVTLLLGLVLPASGRTLVVVAAGLSQIGEFTFIVGQAGVALGILTQDQYGLILASSVISIVFNPLMFRLIPQIEALLKRYVWFWQKMERGGPTPELLETGMRDHVVIVGYGRVGKHVGNVLRHLDMPYLVVEKDADSIDKLKKLGAPTLYGDAANSEVLTHTELNHARALVVTVSDETAAEIIVAAAHDLAPKLPIVARASTERGINRLYEMGAHDIIHPELEGGLEIVRHTLLVLEYPMGQIQQYVDNVRQAAYQDTHQDDEIHPVLDHLIMAVRGVEIAWHPITDKSPVLGKTLVEANLRALLGVSIIALIRNKQVVPNPKSDTRFLEGDLIGLIGDPDELDAVKQYLLA